MNIDALVQLVAQAREIVARTQTRIDQAKHRWQEENAPLLATGRMNKVHLELAELELRNAALQVYATTQEKYPHPAVAIRVGVRVLYDPAVAEAWSVAHGSIAHKLDTKAFEELVKAKRTGNVGTLQEVPQATIATDLSAYVPEPLVDIA